MADDLFYRYSVYSLRGKDPDASRCKSSEAFWIIPLTKPSPKSVWVTDRLSTVIHVNELKQQSVPVVTSLTRAAPI